MVTACSTFAEELMSPSPVPPALLLCLRLRQLEALRNNTNLEGEWTSISSARSTTNLSEGKMERNHSRPWDPDHTWTETEKSGLTALAPLAGVPLPPSGLTPGGWKSGRPTAQANIQLELLEFGPKKLPEWADEFAEFLLLTGQSHVDVATKCSPLKRSCQKKFLQKQLKQILKTCSTWAEVLQRL